MHSTKCFFFYLTADGRYKIKVTIGSKPCLLLVREETELVSRQLSQWADILMLVFSYSSLNSLNQLIEMYQRFTSLRYDTASPSVLLVGVVGECQSRSGWNEVEPVSQYATDLVQLCNVNASTYTYLTAFSDSIYSYIIHTFF